MLTSLYPHWAYASSDIIKSTSINNIKIGPLLAQDTGTTNTGVIINMLKVILGGTDDGSSGDGNDPNNPIDPSNPDAYPTGTSGLLPDGSPPEGVCQDRLDTALAALKTNASVVIPVYQEASKQTGVPWEILAAVHYIETGGSFNPEGSLTSGRKIGVEIEPDQGNVIYKTLLESAIAAGSVFKSKYGSKTGPFNDFQTLVKAFAYYNGTGNTQCEGDKPKPQSKYPSCPASFLMEDHLYPLGCYDARHERMWIIFCKDRQKCEPISPNNPNGNEYRNRVGALTLIRGIQKEYSSLIPGGGGSYPPPTGLLRSPKDAELIALEMHDLCPGKITKYLVDSVNRNNYGNCITPLTKVGSVFKTISQISAMNYSYLQCVGLAHALATEMNGPLGNHGGNAIDQLYTGGNLVKVNKESGPSAGDMVIFSGGSVGHIAYISELLSDNTRFRVVEANMNGKGSVSFGEYSISNSSILGYLRKKASASDPPSNPTPTIAPDSILNPTCANRRSIGTSAGNKPIYVCEYGNGTKKVLIVGGIHGGYESNTSRLVMELMEKVKSNTLTIPSNVKLYMIPVLNPDGYAKYLAKECDFDSSNEKKVVCRTNANGVDLNRNWNSFNWTKTPSLWYGQQLSGGATPFSETETQVLRDFIEMGNIDLTLFYHSARKEIYIGAKDDKWTEIPRAFEIANLIEKAVSEEYKYAKTNNMGATGDAIDYLASDELTKQSMLGLEIELTNHIDTDLSQNVKVFDTIMNWIK